MLCCFLYGTSAGCGLGIVESPRDAGGSDVGYSAPSTENLTSVSAPEGHTPPGHGGPNPGKGPDGGGPPGQNKGKK